MNHRRPGFRKRSSGLWIAFFGPDGAGKSAVISALEPELTGNFGRVVRFHFRPHLGRSGCEQAPMITPHAQSQRGLFLSRCKLLYWLLDCWLGYVFLVLPPLRRSGIIIFDRYLPDLLVDPVRYRLPASAMPFAAKIVRLAPAPDLCILLDAPAECVRQRKQEVSPAESQRQRAAYLLLFHALPRKLVVNADCPIEKIAQRVTAAISELSAQTPHHEAELSDCQLPI